MARLSLSSTDSLEPCFLPIKATRYNAHQFTATSTRVRSTCCKCHEDSLECAAEHFTVKSLILHSCFFLIKSVHFPVVVLCQRKKKELETQSNRIVAGERNVSARVGLTISSTIRRVYHHFKTIFGTRLCDRNVEQRGNQTYLFGCVA